MRSLDLLQLIHPELIEVSALPLSYRVTKTKLNIDTFVQVGLLDTVAHECEHHLVTPSVTFALEILKHELLTLPLRAILLIACPYRQ